MFTKTFFLRCDGRRPCVGHYADCLAKGGRCDHRLRHGLSISYAQTSGDVLRTKTHWYFS